MEAERSFEEVLEASSIGAAGRMQRFGAELKALRHQVGRKLHLVASWAKLTVPRAQAIECGTTGGHPEDPEVTEGELRRYLAALDVEPTPWVEKLRRARLG